MSWTNLPVYEAKLYSLSTGMVVSGMRSDNQDPECSKAFALAEHLRRTISVLTRRLREQATVGELTTAQKSVLLRLERDGPSTGSALARAEAMRPQSMGAIIAVLEAAGHVTCEPDPADGRRSIISLTDRFRDWLADARSARQDWLFHAVRTRLSVQEQDQLTAAIGLLERINAI